MWRAKHWGKESYFTLHLYSFIFFSAQRTYQQHNMYFPKPSLSSSFLEVLKFCFFWGYRWSWWCFVLLKIMHKYHWVILQCAVENEAKNMQLAPNTWLCSRKRAATLISYQIQLKYKATRLVLGPKSPHGIAWHHVHIEYYCSEMAQVPLHLIIPGGCFLKSGVHMLRKIPVNQWGSAENQFSKIWQHVERYLMALTLLFSKHRWIYVNIHKMDSSISHVL